VAAFSPNVAWRSSRKRFQATAGSTVVAGGGWGATRGAGAAWLTAGSAAAATAEQPSALRVIFKARLTAGLLFVRIYYAT
jgi:hypothetical protein